MLSVFAMDNIIEGEKERKQQKMKVTFTGHSGFFVETEKMYFLFDYYNGSIPRMDDEKPLAVFVSHSHDDHYSRRIWDIQKEHSRTVYVLSYDVRAGKKDNVLSLRPGEKKSIEIFGISFTVETFASTDEGVSFFVEHEGETVYHAGDLNIWAWYEEGDDYVNEQRELFREATLPLAERHADAAFILLDPRLGEGGFEGMDAYRQLLDAGNIFPMHQWGRYDFTEEYILKRENTGNIRIITHEGQEFDI